MGGHALVVIRHFCRTLLGYSSIRLHPCRACLRFTENFTPVVLAQVFVLIDGFIICEDDWFYTF